LEDLYYSLSESKRVGILNDKKPKKGRVL
jgi:hypothetical protein